MCESWINITDANYMYINYYRKRLFYRKFTIPVMTCEKIDIKKTHRRDVKPQTNCVKGMPFLTCRMS